jgi:hypothetical protein
METNEAWAKSSLFVWLVTDAGLFWEKGTAGWLLVAGLLWEKSSVGWWLISQANKLKDYDTTASTLVGLWPNDFPPVRARCTVYPRRNHNHFPFPCRAGVQPVTRTTPATLY